MKAVLLCVANLHSMSASIELSKGNKGAAALSLVFLAVTALLFYFEDKK